MLAAAIVTGLAAAWTPGADAASLGQAAVATLSAFGKAFNTNRYVSVVWLVLAAIGMLERLGLQERARTWIAGVHAATVGRLLGVYFVLRQVTSALGLTSLGGHAQMVRPLVAPMAEGAAEARYGSAERPGALPDPRVEHAEVHGNLYGTLRKPMEDALARGEVFLLEIDVQGANQLKLLGEPGLYVFVAPPDFEILRRRLVGRGTDAPEVVERRLKKAEDEYRERVKYDHVVINEDLDRALRQIRSLIGLE